MKTVIEMARDQGLPETEMAGVFIVNQDDLARFAALVIANHPPQSYMTWQEGYEAGRQAEREACAKVCEELQSPPDWNLVAVLWKECRSKLAAAIRARSNT
jgi:hypothetical protein